jgi:hypothetical protein
VNDRPILDVCASSDTNQIYIATDDRAEPNTGVFADLYIANDYGVVRDEGGLVYIGVNTLEWADHMTNFSVDAGTFWDETG